MKGIAFCVIVAILLWSCERSALETVSAEPARIQVSVHGSKPRLVWTGGGLSKRHPYYREVAWIKLTYQGAEYTFFMDDADLQKMVKYFKLGPCPDICDDEGQPRRGMKQRGWDKP